MEGEGEGGGGGKSICDRKVKFILKRVKEITKKDVD